MNEIVKASARSWINLPMRGARMVYDWVMEPIAYEPQLASAEEVHLVMKNAPESRIEPYYNEVIRRGRVDELTRHIDKLRDKIDRDKIILAQGGRDKEFMRRADAIRACNVQNIDTLNALEARLAEIKSQLAA